MGGSSCWLQDSWNLDLGIQAAERLLELVPQHDGTYVLLSNLYATAGYWDDVAKVRKLMRDRGVKKEPGCSLIDVENMVHVFLVDDTKHPEVQAVYKYLEAVYKYQRIIEWDVTDGLEQRMEQYII
ncbi:hypothetical protein C1H46_010666 [Malus baccata]|uniref:DYW domain-containing protein n=1 Tax=Malus baccata TaxID=106549 RepID=A0A540MY27_MALBA|nr:hypothetical protein C1H46_010666 [Malus baccata]